VVHAVDGDGAVLEGRREAGPVAERPQAVAAVLTLDWPDVDVRDVVAVKRRRTIAPPVTVGVD